MEVTDGNGQSVGGIGRLRYFGQVKQARNHVLHLRLLRPTVTHHRRLDGKRRIFGDFQSGRGCSQHSHSSHLPQLQRRLHVERIENVFDGDVVGLVFLNDEAEAFENGRQPPGERFSWRKLDGSASEANKRLVRAEFDDAETRVLGAAINAQDAHEWSLY